MKKITTTRTTLINLDSLHEIRELLEVSESSNVKVIDHTEMNYPLRPVTLEELLDLRKTRKPGFVLKKANLLYYAAIDRDTKFSCQDIFPSKEHLCASDCKLLSALPDDEGGCAKVRDIGRKKRIEKYDFISLGYESFNTSEPSFVVAVCAHYKKSEPKEKLSSADILASKLSLAQFMFPEALTITQARAFSENLRNKRR